MQRKVVDLTPAEAGLLLELTQADLPKLLKEKLEGMAGGNGSQLLSQDEIERLLDLLPPPTLDHQDQAQSSLRQKLRQAVVGGRR